MSENKPTVKEHYIPQFYLRNFSPDGKFIYQYNISSGESKLVPIDSICYKKNLYEFRDYNNQIIYQNTIEKALSVYEAAISDTIKQIEQKAFINENINCPTFLTKEEKAMLTAFVTIQMLRVPYIINEGIKSALKYFPNDETTARNFSLANLLPLFKQLDVNEDKAFFTIMKWFENMAFQIEVSNADVLVTSDKPMVICKENPNKSKRIDFLIMPLTSRIALYMFPIETIPAGKRNVLLKLSDADIRDATYGIMHTANEWIYSKQPLDNKQIMLLKKRKGTEQNALFQHCSRNQREHSRNGVHPRRCTLGGLSERSAA